MKIAIVFDGLQTGGIERVGIDYVKLMLQMGYEVTIFNLVPSLTEMEREIPSNCKIVNLNFPRKISPELYSKLVKKILYVNVHILLSIAF